MRSAICPACGSESTSLLHRSRRLDLTTHRCRTCGLRFIGERLDQRQQAELYNDEDAYRHFAEAERSVAAVPQRRRDWAGVLSAAIRMEEFERQHRRLPRLLDVGCGVGDFLTVARDAGFDAHGIELSAAAAALARQYHQLVVKIGDFASEDRAGYFDAITMFGVLEHVRDPAELLSHSSWLLAPGGVLLIYTPVWGAYDRISSALARLTGGRWSRLIDRRINTAHLQIFPRMTLLQLARKNGFEIRQAVKLCEYNLPVAEYLRSIGIESERIQRAVARAVDALIDNSLSFRNNQRLLLSKPW